MFSTIPQVFLKNFLCFIFFFISFSAIAQENDSIQKYTYEELDDLYWSNIDEDLIVAKKYVVLIYEKAKKDLNHKKIAKALLRMAVIENESKNYKNAHQHIDEAILITKNELKDSELSNEYLIYKGLIYYNATDYENALKCYTKCYEYVKKVNDIRGALDISHNIALIKVITGDLDEAIDTFKKNYLVFSSQEKTKHKNFSSSDLLTTLKAISDTYIEKAIIENGKNKKKVFLDSAIKYNDLGLEKSLFYKNSFKHNSFLIRRGLIHYENENYNKSIKDLNLAHEEAKRINKEKELSTIYFNLAKNYREIGEIDTAIRFFKKTDSIANANNEQSPYLPETYLALTDLYLKKKEYENILKYHNLYVQIDNINDKRTIEMTKKIHKKYELPRLKSEIDLLKKENEIKNTNYTTSLIVIALLIFTFLGFVFYNRKKQHENRLAFDKVMEELEAKKKEVQSKNQKTTIDSELASKRKSSLSIDDEKINTILKALDKFEEKKQFLDINCDLTFVAKKVKTNKAYLSKVIHTQKQQKFIQYITTLRINYALEKLKEDKLFRSYDIKSIASELGFKSPDSFSRAFKKKTGIYPSYYIKNINKINTSEGI